MSVGSVGSAIFTNASGMFDANMRMANVAHNVANANTDRFVPDRVVSEANLGGGVRTRVEPGPTVPSDVIFSQTDLPTEMVNLVAAKHAYAANAKAFSVNARTSKTLINALG